MNKRIKKMWITALRTPADEGGYYQGQHRLVTPTCSKNYEFCCLGVLENLYHLEKNTTFEKFKFAKLGISASTSSWAGICANYREVDELMAMNDSDGASFNEIADYIEKNL